MPYQGEHPQEVNRFAVFLEIIVILNGPRDKFILKYPFMFLMLAEAFRGQGMKYTCPSRQASAVSCAFSSPAPHLFRYD